MSLEESGKEQREDVLGKKAARKNAQMGKSWCIRENE